MNASIIIPTKNRGKILEETISAIFHTQNCPPEKFEVLVINDGGEQLEYLEKQYSTLKILRNNGTGAASARNTGAGMAKNDLLLFIDDDMLISPGCIDKHVALHEKFQKAIISGSWEYNEDMINTLNSTPFGRYKLLYDYKSIEGEEENIISPGIYYSKSLASFNLSILKKDFEELGRFNTSFPFAGCEDQELTIRARQKGFKLLLDTTNISIHNEKDRADMEKWLMRQYTGVQGYVLLCDLFPYRKTEALYIENGLIQKNDTLKVKMKKLMKYTLSSSASLWFIKLLTGILEAFHVTDTVLFKIYNGLGGLFLYKGFRYSQKANSHLIKQ